MAKFWIEAENAQIPQTNLRIRDSLNLDRYLAALIVT
jgi:hypothetical protein